MELAATQMLDRRVSIGTLQIRWGNPLWLRLTDFRLANASWGSAPEMLRFDEVTAEVDLRALLHGVVQYDKLSLKNPLLVLERSGSGDANWRLTRGRTSGAGGLAIIPKNRTQFPTLDDFTLDGGLLIFR